MQSRFPRHVVDHIELYLTVVGLAVIFVLPALVDFGDEWFERGVTAIAVGVVHAFVFWTVRRRQLRRRRELLRELRATLGRKVDTALDRVLVNIQPPDRELTPDDRERLTEVAAAVRDIAATIEGVSLDSLAGWRRADD